MMSGKVIRRVAVFVALLLGAAAAPARANFVFDLTVNTSSLVDSGNNSLTGTQGLLDLQFNPTGGTGILSATVQALPTNDTTLGTINFLGNVTGPGGSTPVSGLPLKFLADNTNGPQINDATMSVTFGTTLALSLDITPSDANSTASFFLTLYDQFSNPISPNPGGNTPAIVELDLLPNPSGTSPLVSPPLLGDGAKVVPMAGATPEPSSFLLFASLLPSGWLLARGLRPSRTRGRELQAPRAESL